MTDKIKDGGPAFPTTKPLDGWGDPNAGMSLRDWFAGQALVGLLSSNARSRSDDPHGALSIASYAVADAMLAAREASHD